MSAGELIRMLFDLGLPFILFMVGWYFGTRNEHKHLRELDRNEHLLGHIILSSERFYQPTLLARSTGLAGSTGSTASNGSTGSQSELVLGSVVVAQDYFKMIIAGIMNLLGRNLSTYETLLERARREALVRMKREAHELGHNQIYGVRLEVTSIDELGKMVEAIAYGTAVTTTGNPKVPPALPPVGMNHAQQ